MNREIKFRVWIPDEGENGKMFTLPFSDGEHIEGFTDTGIEICRHNDYIVKVVGLDDENISEGFQPCDAIIMQFTGLKDVNDKEIYEGDILKFTSLVCFSSKKGSIYEEAIAEVIWSIGGAGFTPHVLSGHLHSFDMTKGEIIGNIYETPKLKAIPMKFAECVFCASYNNKHQYCEDQTSYDCTKGKHSVHPGHFIQKDL